MMYACAAFGLFSFLLLGYSSTPRLTGACFVTTSLMVCVYVRTATTCSWLRLCWLRSCWLRFVLVALVLVSVALVTLLLGVYEVFIRACT